MLEHSTEAALRERMQNDDPVIASAGDGGAVVTSTDDVVVDELPTKFDPVVSHVIDSLKTHDIIKAMFSHDMAAPKTKESLRAFIAKFTALNPELAAKILESYEIL